MKKYAIYHGPKYGDDKVAFFSNADIFAQPTLNDCFPLTLLEAMQYQLPIVSTHEGAVPDIVKDGKNGYIIDPHHETKFIEKLMLAFYSMKPLKMQLVVKENMMVSSFEEHIKSLYARMENL